MPVEFDAFISHSSKDKTMADAICAKLEQAGIRCWIAPRDVSPGKTWSGEIMKAIDQCKVMVLVFSSNANESAQIVRELEAAVHQSKPILPLRSQDILPTDEMAYFMNSVHWLDAITEPVEAHLDQLVQAVSALLGKPVLGMGETLKDIPVPPPPVPPPRPSFDWKPILYIAPGAIALLLFILYLALDHFGSQVKQAEIVSGPLVVSTAPNVASAPAAAQPNSTPIPFGSSGSADASLTGTWYLLANLVGYTGLSTLTYSPGGTYVGETLLTDSGTYQSGAGQWSTTSNGSGTTRQGTYQYAGGHTLKVTDPLGIAFYNPATPQTIDPSNPVMLGIWTATVRPPNSPPWNMTLTNNPDGTYAFQIDIVDKGTYTSGGDTYTMKSQVTGLAVNGTFRPIDQDTASITGPLGTATWSRTKP